MKSFTSKAKDSFAVVFHEMQLLRLAIDRFIGRMFYPSRIRILATACWNFPIYSQTFVYQELVQLMRSGFRLRFIYSKLDSRDFLPPQFNELWEVKRRLSLHPAVCRRNYDHFMRKLPSRINELVAWISEETKMTPEKIREHHHFLQAFSFVRMAEAFRPDYIHSYFFYDGTLFALFASYLLDIPRGMSCYADHMMKDYDLKLVPLHLKQCRIVIATSQRIKQELIGLSGANDSDHILVKPNAINARQFPSVPHTEPGPAESFRLVCVNRIEPKKGLTYLAQSIRKLLDRGLKVELHMIGDVDNTPICLNYASELKQLIHELGLQGVIHLEGRKSEPEIKQFFQISQIFVAPFVETEYGDKDGIPTSLQEAMSSGLPVVGTDAGSIPELIENRVDGIIVPQRNPDALASEIESLIKNRDYRKELGANAARKIHEQFNAEQWEKIFHNRLRILLSSPNLESAEERGSLTT